MCVCVIVVVIVAVCVRDDSQAPRSPPALGAAAGVEELTVPVLPPPTFASTLESLAEIFLSIEITVLRSDMMQVVFVSLSCQEKKIFFFELDIFLRDWFPK